MTIVLDNSKVGSISNYIKENTQRDSEITITSSIFTIFAFEELRKVLEESKKFRFLFNEPTFIKNIIQRPRAFTTFPDIEIIIKAPLSYSFPSGHTASSFAAAVVLGYYIKNWKYLFYFFAALVAFSRLYLFVHYPSDIIGGISLGVVCSLMTIKIIENSKCKKLS